MNASRTPTPVISAAGWTPITEDGVLAGARDSHIHRGRQALVNVVCAR
jgi:hypothetical protein